ncbi:unnamed protein product [Lota lota]
MLICWGTPVLTHPVYPKRTSCTRSNQINDHGGGSARQAGGPICSSVAAIKWRAATSPRSAHTTLHRALQLPWAPGGWLVPSDDGTSKGPHLMPAWLFLAWMDPHVVLTTGVLPSVLNTLQPEQGKVTAQKCEVETERAHDALIPNRSPTF